MSEIYTHNQAFVVWWSPGKFRSGLLLTKIPHVEKPELTATNAYVRTSSKPCGVHVQVKQLT